MQIFTCNKYVNKRCACRLSAVYYFLICIIIFCFVALCDSNSEIIWTGEKNTLSREEVNLYLGRQGYDWTQDSDYIQLMNIELKMYKAKEKLIPLFRERLSNTKVKDYESSSILQFILDSNSDYSEIVDTFRIQCRHSKTHVVRFAIKALGKYGNDKDISMIASFLNSNMNISDTNRIDSVKLECIAVLETKGNKSHEQEIQKFINQRNVKLADNIQKDKLKQMAEKVLNKINLRQRGESKNPQ